MRGLNDVGQRTRVNKGPGVLTAHLHLAILRQERLQVIRKRRVRPLIPERRLNADYQALR